MTRLSILPASILVLLAGAPSTVQAQSYDEVRRVGDACYSFVVGLEEYDGGIRPQDAGLIYGRRMESSGSDFEGHEYSNAASTIRFNHYSQNDSHGHERYACDITLGPVRYDVGLRVAESLIRDRAMAVGPPAVTPGIRDVDRSRSHLWVGDDFYLSLVEISASSTHPGGSVVLHLSDNE